MFPYDRRVGKGLEIDLTEETFRVFPLPYEMPVQTWSKALAVALLDQYLDVGKATLSPEAPIVITTGPLTGSGAPGSGRFDLAALSPRDALPSISNCGGKMGVSLKKAGYDALVIRGACARPRWLEVGEGFVCFHDAASLWGSETGPCRTELIRLLSGQAHAALCIGPAGENLVKFASVLADGRSTGRAGIGAVMGSKKLKAVTITGNQSARFHDPERVAALNRQWYAHLRESAATVSGSHCTDCPLHCDRHGRGDDRRLDELGLDAISAEQAVRWVAQQGWKTPDLIEAIALRRGIGDLLAEGIPGAKKNGKRRKGSFDHIAKAFTLPPDRPETVEFCKNLTEAVSGAGLCMFSLNAMRPDFFPIVKMLEAVTGQPMDLDALIDTGRQSRMLERQLMDRFQQ